MCNLTMRNIGDIVNVITSEKEEQNFMTDALFSLLMFVAIGVVCCIISIIGICANIANIGTFTKLGFQETINITLSALAVADFSSLLFLLWLSLCNNPYFTNIFSDIIDLQQVSFIIGGMERAYFTMVGGCITTLAAVQRCICVLKPLQVKVILTKGRLVVINCSIFIMVFMLFIPICYTTGVGWVFNSVTNRSFVSLKRKPNTYDIVSKSYGVMAVVRVTTYVLVSICTVIIAGKLASQSAWRANMEKKAPEKKGGQDMKNQSGESTTLSARDKRATSTVTLIATLYIVCFCPGAILTLTMSFVPEFNKGKLYGHAFELCWAVAYIFEGICSSANIVVYLKTSTKFKEAFIGLFTNNGR